MDLTSSITLSRRTTSKVASKVISATMNVGAGATSKVAKTINAAKLTAAGTEKLTPSVLLNRLRNPAPLKPSEHVTEIVEVSFWPLLRLALFPVVSVASVFTVLPPFPFLAVAAAEHGRPHVSD